MSATGFHPEPSAKAPWTRTIVLTAAYAGDATAKTAPVSRARIKRFMVHSANVGDSQRCDASHYSITSLARASSVGSTVKPSAMYGYPTASKRLFLPVSASFYKPYLPTTSFNAGVVAPLADSLRAAI